MNSKCNGSKNTKVIVNRVEKEGKQSHTQGICFEIQVQSSTSPPSPREEFHYPLRTFYKGTSTKEL